MTTMTSQITSLTVVYSTVYSRPRSKKHQSSASLAFVWGIHRGPVNSPHKWPVTRKMLPFDDVIMTPEGIQNATLAHMRRLLWFALALGQVWTFQNIRYIRWHQDIPDSKVHGAYMGPIRGRQDPGGPHMLAPWSLLSGILPEKVAWWRHGMETLSALLALCDGNPSVTGGHKGPLMGSFNVSFYANLRKLLNKQSRGRRMKMFWWSFNVAVMVDHGLWRHCDVTRPQWVDQLDSIIRHADI